MTEQTFFERANKGSATLVSLGLTLLLTGSPALAAPEVPPITMSKKMTLTTAASLGNQVQSARLCRIPSSLTLNLETAYTTHLEMLEHLKAVHHLFPEVLVARGIEKQPTVEEFKAAFEGGTNQAQLTILTEGMSACDTVNGSRLKMERALATQTLKHKSLMSDIDQEIHRIKNPTLWGQFSGMIAEWWKSFLAMLPEPS